MRYVEASLLRLLCSAYKPRPKSLEIQCFKQSDMIEIRDKIIFAFYPGLPLVYMVALCPFFRLKCVFHFAPLLAVPRVLISSFMTSAL